MDNGLRYVIKLHTDSVMKLDTDSSLKLNAVSVLKLHTEVMRHLWCILTLTCIIIRPPRAGSRMEAWTF
jgi:hypothetical protein